MDWSVDKGAILGTSPIALPARCAECGRDTSQETRVDTVLRWYPAWIWVGILWGVIPVVLLYFAARRKLRISYSLCPEHRRALAAKKRAVFALWAVFVAVVIAASAMQYNSYLLLATLVLFVFALVFHLAAGLRLRVRRHKDGVFTVAGFGREFLAEMARPLEYLPDSTA